MMTDESKEHGKGLCGSSLPYNPVFPLTGKQFPGKAFRI
jgi:hypothetical protein